MADTTELKARIDSPDKLQYGKGRFVATVKGFMAVKSLLKLLLHELADKIEFYETKGVGKSRTQRIAIYWRFVGYVKLPKYTPNRNCKQDTRQGVAAECIPA